MCFNIYGNDELKYTNYIYPKFPHIQVKARSSICPTIEYIYFLIETYVFNNHDEFIDCIINGNILSSIISRYLEINDSDIVQDLLETIIEISLSQINDDFIFDSHFKFLISHLEYLFSVLQKKGR